MSYPTIGRIDSSTLFRNYRIIRTMQRSIIVSSDWRRLDYNIYNLQLLTYSIPWTCSHQTATIWHYQLLTYCQIADLTLTLSFAEPDFSYILPFVESCSSWGILQLPGIPLTHYQFHTHTATDRFHTFIHGVSRHLEGGGKVQGASLRVGKMRGTLRGRLWLVGGERVTSHFTQR